MRFMAKEYVTPKILGRDVNVQNRMLANTPTSTSSMNMRISNDKTITNSDEILTKERNFFEDGLLGFDGW